MDFVFNNITGREVVYYESAWIFGTIFFIIVLLNVVRSRFWCRYLCPLGALWGVMGNFSFFKVRGNENCTNCGRCNESCYACAIDGNNNAMPSECMLLFNCKDVCSNKAISYSYGISKVNIALTKRNFLKTVTYGFCVSIIFKMTGGFPEKNEKLIRPPGALSENDFLKTCVRCGACMKVCPQNFLTPSIFEGNLLDLFTPVGNAAYGYCVYNCNLCGKACPTGAIKALTVQDKNRFVIGTAFIDKNRCLPHAFNTNCAVCEEHCPTSPKAIIFNSEKTRDSDGKEILINKPVVDARRCIGCGICQYKCPVTDRPAIYITAIKNGGVINSSIREYHEER
jgi:MauM/NapG family ferredoxin protein